MELAFSVWGGIFSPIIPYYAELTEQFRLEYGIDITTPDFYINTINNYDPDVLIVDEEVDIEFVKSISNGRQIELNIEFNENLSNSNKATISYIDIAEHFLKNEFKFVRNDGAKFSIPKIEDGQLLLKSIKGSIPNRLREHTRALFQGNQSFEEPTLNWNTLLDYRKTIRADVTELNVYKLRSWRDKHYHTDSAIYFLRSNEVNDLLNFWNLRAAGWYVVPVPVDSDNYQFFKEVIAHFIEFTISENSLSINILKLLIGNGISETTVESTIKKIAPNLNAYNVQIHLSYQNWFPRFWHSQEVLNADHITSATPYLDTFFDHIDTEGDTLRFTPHKIPFELQDFNSWNELYKIIISFSLYDEYAEYAELLHGITNDQLKQLLNTFDFRHWRHSRTGLHRTVKKTDDNIRFDIPKSVDFFTSYFLNREHKLNETVNSRLAKEVLKNIGGLNWSRFFLTPTRLKIIELFEGSKDVLYTTLTGEIKKQTKENDNSFTRHFIKQLLDKKIVEMGARLKCSVCGQHSFYLVSQLSEELVCSVCRNQFELPTHNPNSIEWSYRGIGPFSRNNKADGIMSVFATLKLFKDEFTNIDGRMSALIGFELIKVGVEREVNPKEIDLAILLQDKFDNEKEPILLFCECKTYIRIIDKDVERMKILGEEFPGAVLSFATLNATLEDSEINLIANLARHFQTGSGNRPRNSVLILTGKELLNTEFRDAFKAYKDDLKPFHLYHDYIGRLSDLSVKKHLKIRTWPEIKEDERNDEIQRRKSIALIVKSLDDRLKFDPIAWTPHSS